MNEKTPSSSETKDDDGKAFKSLLTWCNDIMNDDGEILWITHKRRHYCSAAESISLFIMQMYLLILHTFPLQVHHHYEYLSYHTKFRLKGTCWRSILIHNLLPVSTSCDCKFNNKSCEQHHRIAIHNHHNNHYDQRIITKSSHFSICSVNLTSSFTTNTAHLTYLTHWLTILQHKASLVDRKR